MFLLCCRLEAFKSKIRLADRGFSFQEVLADSHGHGRSSVILTPK